MQRIPLETQPCIWQPLKATQQVRTTYLSKAEQLDLLMVFKTVITAILGFSPNLMAKNNAGFTAADLGKMKFVRF